MPAKKGFFSWLWSFGHKKEEKVVFPPSSRPVTTSRVTPMSGTNVSTGPATVTTASDRSSGTSGRTEEADCGCGTGIRTSQPFTEPVNPVT